jgi:enamine deaminase RidA (YjgF/YER057c/UK114 family)
LTAITYLSSEELPPSPGYTQVLSAQGTRTVYVSGQVAVDAQGALVGEGDLRAQTEQVFANLQTALAAAQASFVDVVKLTTFVVNLTPEALATVREVRKRYLDAERLPTSTLVGVTVLANPAWLIEIEAIAVLEQ